MNYTSTTITEQLNLRPTDAAGSNRLKPVGAPAVVSLRPWRCIASVPTGSGMVAEFVSDGMMLGGAVRSVGELPSEPAEIGEPGFRPEGAVALGEGRFLIMGEGKSAPAVADESGLLRLEAGADADFPEAVIEARSEATLTEPIPSFRLAGSYNGHSTVLSGADEATLGASIGAAYRQLSANAVASGYCIQSVKARYALYDAAGTLLHRSAAVLLQTPSGTLLPAASVVGIDQADPSRTLPSSLAVQGFKLYVRLPAVGVMGSAAGKRVARLDVELTPQLHLPDPALKSSSRFLSAAGSQLSFEAKAPGCALDSECYRRSLLRAVEADDSAFRVALSIAYPFAAGSGERYVQVAPLPLSYEREKQLMEAAMAVDKPSLSEVEVVRARCRPPHRCAPGSAVALTGVALAGSPTVRLFSGNTLDFFAQRRGHIGSYESVVSVELEGGRRRVVSYKAANGAVPESVGPLFTYPDPTATRATFSLQKSDGSFRSLTVDLTPCRSGAYWLSPTALPVELPAGAEGTEFNLPPQIAHAITYPGYLVAAASLWPLEALSAMKLEGDIVDILPAPRPAGSSWESASPRYIVVGSGGTWSVGVKSGGTISGPVKLDSRPVSSRSAVTPASPGAANSRLYIIAGTDLIEVSSNKVATLRRAIDGRMVGWNSTHGELYIATPGAIRARVFTPGSGRWSARTLPAVGELFSREGAARLTSPSSGYFDLSSEVASPARCTLSLDFPLLDPRPASAAAPPAEVVVDIASSEANGTIDIVASHGARTFTPLSRLAFSGALHAPIVWRLLMPRRYRHRLTVDALFSPDTLISPDIIIG